MLYKNLPINSLSNPKYKELLDVKEKGKKVGKILVEGEDLIDLAIKSHKLLKVISTTYQYRYEDYEQIIVSNELMRNLSSYNSLPKAMGVCSFDLSDEMTDQVIYLDGIQDPGNLGAIMRSCLAFGYKTIILSKDSVSPYNFKAVQASKGSLFFLNINYMDLGELKSKGYKLVMTLLDGTDVTKVSKPEGKYAIVIGNEGQGIKKDNIKLADMKVLLPINPLIDSLNAAIACSIMVFLWRNI